MLKRLLVCFSLATVCFLNTWVELAEADSVYFARHDPLYSVVFPVICWELFLALTIYSAWGFYLKHRPKNPAIFHVLFLFCCFVPLGIAAVAALRASPFPLTPLVRKPFFWPVALGVALVPLALVLRRPAAASRLVREAALYAWPVLAIVLVQAGRGALFRYSPSDYADGPLAAILPGPPPRVRIVWIVFDELNQATVFDRRPAGLALPNFDRLRAGSFYASTATSPANTTEISLPSLILGQPILRADPNGPNHLLLQSASKSEPFDWGAVPNVFDTARSLGFNTALIGWFHPYGRLLNRSLVRCNWTAGWLLSGVEEPTEPQPLAKAMWTRARLQFSVLPLAGHIPGVFPGVYHREDKIRRFGYLLDCALQVAADPSVGLALIHLPIPHPPAIYNRHTRTMTAQGSIGYVDSVALADQTLGDLQTTLDTSGLAGRTALLVTSDHGWRTTMWRGDPEWTAEEEIAARGDTSGVPFLLKLPGQAAAIPYSQPFNTVVTRRLLTEILQGQLTDPAGISASIERRMAALGLR